MRFLLGGYTADMGGTASGIGVLLAGEDGDPLAGGPLAFAGDAVAAGGSPSWVTWHPTLDVVYAALEGSGTIRAYRRTGARTFAPLGDAVDAGRAVCHVAVSPDGAWLVASCWGDGRVVRMRVDAVGRPSAPVIAAAATDPHGAAAEDGLIEFGAARLVEFGSGRASGGEGERGDTGGPDDRRNRSGGRARSIDRDDRDDRKGAMESDAERAASRVESGMRPRPATEPMEGLAAAARALREAAGAEFAHLIPEYAEPEVDAVSVVEPGSDARTSRAHQAVFLPHGLVATTDLGFDLVRFWRLTPSGLRTGQQVVLPRGSGPRHMLWHPSGHLYVLTELSHELFVLAPDESGTWRIVGGTLLGVGLGSTDAAAELTASRDATFVYAGVRGSDTIATLRVRGNGGWVESVALVESGVDGPRHQAVARDTLLVAGQLSDDVVSLALDERTGVPGRVRRRTSAPSPTCIVPLR